MNTVNAVNFSLYLRIPGRCNNASVKINGKAVKVNGPGDLNERSPADQFEIIRKPWPKNNFPFTQDAVPVLLKAKGKIIPSWTLDRYGLCAILPQSPVTVDTKEKRLN